MSEFRSFVAEKELEWKTALNQQIALLEQNLASRESELKEERRMTAQLKEDFKYNIRLVKERDEELGSLERENIVLKQQCLALEDKLSAISVKYDESAQKCEEEAYTKAKLSDHYKSMLDSREREAQLMKHEHELEMSRLRDEQQALRRQLEMENVRCKRELEVQRRELTGAFDCRADELQDEYRGRVLQMEKALLDSELKCDLLEKDNASVQKARLDLLSRLETCESEAAALEKKLVETSTRYQSDIAVLENEKERLQELAASLEVNHRSAVERLEEKLKSLQADGASKESVILANANKLKEERSSIRRQTADLVAKLHEAEASFQRKATEFSATLRGKDEAIEKLTAHIEELQTQLHATKANVGRLFVDRDAEIDRLKQQLQGATEELHNRKADIERYKHELQLALTKEQEFEASRQQMEIDYQRRTEELETLQYEKSETYIEKLTQARNEALNELDELKTTLSQKQTFIQSLLKDREVALEALKEYGINLDRRFESKAVESDQLLAAEKRIKDLLLQNETLKEIIKQMRQEMESLQGPQSKTPRVGGLAAEPPIGIGDVRSIQELSNVLAKLRNEKTDLLAQCRKQQARIAHLEARLAECQTEKTAADTAAEQLRYQVSAQERHHATEAAGQKRRLQELEAQLDESQREADEYYKANIEQGKLCEQLQHDVLLLKSKSHSAKPGEVNFGAQELYIQQLQNEIENLRDKMQARQLYGETDGGGGEQSGDSQLKAKLRMAANQIKKLAQENQALVDLSNRLRAELKAAASGAAKSRPTVARGREVHYPDYQREPIEMESHSRRAVKDAVGDMTSKLHELERMQYYLTKEELAKRNAATTASTKPKASSAEASGGHLRDSDVPVKDTADVLPRAEGLRRGTAGSGALKDSLAFSSVGGESLRDVWQLLDESQQPPVTSRVVVQEVEEPSRNQALSSLRVRGLAARPQGRPQ